MKKQLNEIHRMQQLAGIRPLNEISISNTNELRNIEAELEEAGLNFGDGILGGVGSGGGGYYDYISDKISGYNLDEFNENEFNSWYDGFSKDKFNEFTYEREEREENEDGVDYDMIKQIGVGIYLVGEQLEYGGQAEIDENGDLTVYAIPTLSDLDGDESFAIFTLRSNGSIKPEIDKNELMNKLKENIENPGTWGIV